ncbi:hypothetical protein EYZ11_005328 [Aspergillus tanneri]|uniref:Transcription factor domain-containing protein n=1 Tax=Aspergillus tanneri TaxID=1220188 RepID=A0A4S3JIN1_9EURO|nr:hypothetical protein EYZ11_005328 [Aspergillus tanneri]
MDTNLPEPGDSTPYLTCMITYSRLSTKIWGLVVGWRSRSRSATSDYCSYLDFQVQQWIQSIPRELRFDPSERGSGSAPQTDNVMMLQVLLALQANQLRILVYRQNLLSGESIETNVSGASVAVETAKSTVHMLDYFSRISEIYFQRPEPFNYFLISALAALFLAVLHAPSQFSQVCRPEFYAAVNMVRKSSTRARTSRRLQKIIRSLKLIRLNLPPGRDVPCHQRERKHSQQHRIAQSASLPTATPSANPVSQPNQQQQNPASATPTPQVAASLWSFSPAPTMTDDHARNDNSCEDLTSFFELAGGLYFDPRTGPNDGLATETGTEGIAFQAEEEALTKVMAGQDLFQGQ